PSSCCSRCSCGPFSGACSVLLSASPLPSPDLRFVPGPALPDGWQCCWAHPATILRSGCRQSERRGRVGRCGPGVRVGHRAGLCVAETALDRGLLWLLLPAGGSLAQAPSDPGQPVAVGLYAGPPFVIDEKGRFTVMAVELWGALAEMQGL